MILTGKATIFWVNKVYFCLLPLIKEKTILRNLIGYRHSIV